MSMASAVEDLEENPDGGEKKFQRSDSDLKCLLNHLVREANFLVEENLNILVQDDDITEDEKNLFRLDSILNTIGMKGEEEVLAVLRNFQLDATCSPGKVKDNILKIIRGHLEGSDEEVAAYPELRKASAAPTEVRSQGGRGTAWVQSRQSGADSLQEMIQEWDVMIKSVEMLVDEERRAILAKLSDVRPNLVTVGKMEEHIKRVGKEWRALLAVSGRLQFD